LIDPRRGGQGDVFQDDAAEHFRIAEAFAGIQDFYPRDPTVCRLVHRNPLRDVLCGHSCFEKTDIKRIYFGVVGNSHGL
jgi:hypothetical protein